jgi:hypothetical protein
MCQAKLLAQRSDASIAQTIDKPRSSAKGKGFLAAALKISSPRLR